MAAAGDAKQTSGDLDFRLDPWIPGRHVGPRPDQLHGPRLGHGRSENNQDLACCPKDLLGTASPRRSSREARAQRHRWPCSRDCVGVRRQAPIASIALMDTSMESLWLPTRQRRRSPQARIRSNLSSGCFGCRLQGFRCHCRVVEQVSISGRDGQKTSNHQSTANLLNRLNLPAPTRSKVVKVLRNGVPGAVGQGRSALLPGLENARVNWTRQIPPGLHPGPHRPLLGW